MVTSKKTQEQVQNERAKRTEKQKQTETKNSPEGQTCKKAEIYFPPLTNKSR